MPSVLLIMGSTRAGRACPKITDWVAGIGRAITALEFEIIDLADWHLPMDDEPEIPAKGLYHEPHTQAWSAKVTAAAAVVFVTPQYNWGYPAVLKNALDHLYHEWRGKPAAIVTYGGHGGGKCAEQLRQVTGSVKMDLVETMPALTLPDATIRENAPFDPNRDFADSRATVEAALAELAAKLAA